MWDSSWRPPNFAFAPSGTLSISTRPGSRLVAMRSNRTMRMNWQPEGMSLNQLKERGCSSLEEYIAALDSRRQERDALNEYVSRTDISGQDKGWARCDYILRNLRLPFQCNTCWLLPGHCICNSLRRYQAKTKVVIHLHPDEWAKGSNTGCLCNSLSGSELLMKGHKQHDQRLQQLLSDPSYTCAILWPGDDALEPHQLQQLAAEHSQGRIALIALDATWDGARKMRSKYPPGVHMLKLPPHLALPTHTTQQQQATTVQQPAALRPAAQQGLAQQQQEASAEQRQQPQCQQHCGSELSSKPDAQSNGIHLTASSGKASHSLFRPLRKYHGNAAETGRVCTVEAVAAALLALEGDADMYEGLLYNLKLKVDAMRRQKHIAEVYGTGTASVEDL